MPNAGDKFIAYSRVDKKEQILLRSFFRLIEPDLTTHFVEVADGDSDTPIDLLIIGDSDASTNEPSQAGCTLMLIDQVDSDADSFQLARPVQWGAFHSIMQAIEAYLISLSEPESESVTLELTQEIPFAESASDASFSVLPNDLQLQLIDDDRRLVNLPSIDKPKDDAVYHYVLEEISFSSDVYTSSDQIRVVDDVKDYEVSKGEVEAVLLLSDDESASVNSVLLTKSVSEDDWDLLPADEADDQHMDTAQAQIAKALEGSGEADLPSDDESEARPQPIDLSRPFWRQDVELYADHHLVLYIQAGQKRVYSVLEPGRWSMALRGKLLHQRPLAQDWRPEGAMRVYPLSRLLWVVDFITRTDQLLSPMSDDAHYKLSQWPTFDVLEMDNRLLRLATILLLRGGSATSLIQELQCDSALVIGFMNACYRAGHWVGAEKDEVELNTIESETSVLDFFKHAFR